MADGFISLHNRSAYSFGSALTTPRQLVDFAVANGMPAIALTDLSGLYAAVRFQQACHGAGIKPIFGAELPLCRDSFLGVTRPSAVPRIPSRHQTPGESLRPSNGPVSVILLACDLAGYGNLCRLISVHHLRDRPLTPDDLCQVARGLICLLGGQNTDPPAATLRDAFQNRLYIELAIHTPAEAAVARRRARLADALGLPVVAVCESRCPHPDHALILKALASIGTLTLLDQPHPDKPVGAWHLRTPHEMQRLFARCPDALANTLAIAEQCNVTLDLSQSRFPGFASPDGRTAIEHLRQLAVAGCRRRYVDEPPLRGIGGYRPTLDEAVARLDRELSVIEQVHYAEYFLVFHEIAEYCRREGISFLARGSAADSLVCYALGVSHACPFRFDLPFDRFINPERARFSKMADIDLDLPWDQRDQVIRWVYARWGHDRVAMIGSANTFHARAAVAELGKVYGLPSHEVHRVTKLLPYSRIWNLPDAIAQSPESQELLISHGASPIASVSPPIRTATVRERSSSTSAKPLAGGQSSDRANSVTLDEPYATILKLACHLDGLPRHWAMHPCGLVVSPEPLTDLVPVQRSPKGMLVAQYDMDAIEDLGFVKIDLLGQAGLSVLRDAVNEINRVPNGVAPANNRCKFPSLESTPSPPDKVPPINLNQDVDYSEPETWDMIATGNARGVHHIESPAMTSLIQQCNCRDIDCLTAVVAIIRPGAANQGKKEAFARRYQGFEPPSYAHPSLVAPLKNTYGLMVFEEHILQVAVEFAGMNLGRADVLRRALNKQNLPLIAELKSEFYACALLHGRRPAEIDVVWPFVEGFAGFMFNKAHSAEYAVEAFQGAWLKRRWPAHYLAAILSNYRGFYAGSPTLPQILYVMEAHRLGIRFLPPCVNRSREHFSVEHPESPPPMRDSYPSLVRESLLAPTSSGILSRKSPVAPSVSILDGEHRSQALKGRQNPSGSLLSNLESEISNFKSQISNPSALAIRVPVSHIASLSQSFLDRYATARAEGPFDSLPDFVARCRPTDSEAQSLLDAGALDCFNLSRPAIFWQLRRLLRRSYSAPSLWSAFDQERAALRTQHSAAAPDPDNPALPIEFTEPDLRQVAQREMDLLGFPITIDPLTFLGRDDKGREIDWSRYVPVDQLGRHLRRRVAVCGLMVADRINATQSGDLMKFVTLADRTGFIETILFPDTYRRFGHLTVANPILAAAGIVEPFENGNGFTLRVQQVSPPLRKRENNSHSASVSGLVTGSRE